MRCLNGLTAALAVSAMLGAASPAAAKIVKATLAGGWSFGYDQTGVLDVTTTFWTGWMTTFVYDTSGITPIIPFPGAAPVGTEVVNPFLSATLYAVRGRGVFGPNAVFEPFGSFDMAPLAGRVGLAYDTYHFEIDYQDQIVVPGFEGGQPLDRMHTLVFDFNAQGNTSLDTMGFIQPRANNAPIYQQIYLSLVAEWGESSYYRIYAGQDPFLVYAKFEDVTAEYEPTTPMPEPGTWALMLPGFGFAGAALRRRRFALAR